MIIIRENFKYNCRNYIFKIVSAYSITVYRNGRSEHAEFFHTPRLFVFAFENA